MIRLAEPAELGQALAQVREMQGMTRPDCARAIAALTGRPWRSVNSQLWTWDTGTSKPESWAIGPYLHVLDLQLCLDFKEEKT